MVMTDLLAVLVPALPLAGAVLLSALRRKLSATVAGSIATALIAGLLRCQGHAVLRASMPKPVGAR